MWRKKETPFGTSASSPPRTEGIKLIDALTLVRVRAVGISLGEVRQRFFRVRLHRCTAFVPVCGANFAVLVL